MSDQPTANSALDTERGSNAKPRERAFPRRIVDPAPTALLAMELQTASLAAMVSDLARQVEHLCPPDVVAEVPLDFAQAVLASV